MLYAWQVIRIPKLSSYRVMTSAASNSTTSAYLLLVFTAMCFGANTTLAKLTVDEVSPMVVVALRWLIVAVLLLLFNAKTLVHDWPKLKPHAGFLFVMGALGFAVFNGLFFSAAQYTSAINMGIISGMLPVFVLIGAFLIYRTPVGALQWLGTGLTLVGVAVVASAGDLGRLFRLSLNYGDLLIAISALVYAGYTVGLRRKPESSAIALFGVLAASAFIASLPLVAVEGWMGEMQMPTLRGWWLVALVALFPTFLAQLAFIKGVEMVGPGRAIIFVNLVPVFSAAVAVVFLGEDFHLYHGIALALVLGGIWVAESSEAKEPSLEV